MFKRLLVPALLGFVSVDAGACEIENLWFENAFFQTEIEALNYVEARYGADSRRTDTEYVGALYDAGERFRINVGRGCGGEDAFSARIPVIEGVPIMAFWHTHGEAGPSRTLFSPEDVAIVRSTARPFYLITPSGRLRVLTPSMIDQHEPLRGSHRGKPVQSLTSATNR
ncbi:MAG: DUF4329 domain-containing protein [Gammaproteobacteria bacterium]|nr:DUF4329 domain-containing protein [Gammaproteobacteria bacterium]